MNTPEIPEDVASPLTALLNRVVFVDPADAPPPLTPEDAVCGILLEDLD